jgi:type IV pilus assembly protein PilW
MAKLNFAYRDRVESSRRFAVARSGVWRGRIARLRGQRGVSLVELMVALAVGLIAFLVIAQTFATFEGQKRTTTSGADAQENGLMGLHAIQADLRQAGYGLVTPPPANATTGWSPSLICTAYISGCIAAPGQPILPAQIIDGGAAGSDTIMVNYSTSAAGDIPAGILATATAPSPSTIVVQAPVLSAFKVGDLILLASPDSSPAGAPCSLMQITAPVPYALGANTVITAGAYPAGAITFPAAGYGADPQSYVVNMGTMGNAVYAVTPGNTLTVQNSVPGAAANCTTAVPAAATPIADNIVALQAQYGIAPVGSQQVNCWVNATAGGNVCDLGNWSSTATTTAITPANAVRIKAIRIAIVARSGKMEKINVTFPQTCPSGVANNGPCLWEDDVANRAPALDLSGLPNWQQYRYKVYTTIVPLHNILWNNL